MGLKHVEDIKNEFVIYAFPWLMLYNRLIVRSPLTMTSLTSTLTFTICYHVVKKIDNEMGWAFGMHGGEEK
jgi:hypothetical protein